MEQLVFDTSSIISMSERCMLQILENMAKGAGVGYVISESVYNEAVSRPLEIKRFEYNAVRVQDLVKKGVIRTEKTDREISRLADQIQSAANAVFRHGQHAIEVVQRGEAEALALVRKIGAAALVMDERTTRMLIEQPEKMAWLIKHRTGKDVNVDKPNLRAISDMFSGITIVRSAELFAFAYENGHFGEALPHTKDALEAGLYALKYAGCAVTVGEIKKYIRGVGG